ELPVTFAATEVHPLAGRPLVQPRSEAHRRGRLEVAAERLVEDRRQLVRVPAARRDYSPHRRWLLEDAVAVAVRMEDLTIDVRGAVGSEIHNQGGDVVGVSLRPHGLLTRPLAGLLEDFASAGRGVDHARGATGHDGVGGDAVATHGGRGRPGE